MTAVGYRIITRQLHASFYHGSISKTMRKVMGSSSKKKQRYIEDAQVLPNPTFFSKGSLEGKTSENSKRASTLNKLFMRYITDLMATGESASEFVGHGIEVNRVKVTPDYKLVRVYWIASGTKSDQDIDKLLQKNAGVLRHELSQLRVMGVVPKIVFVKDKHYANVMEVDSRLNKADFGEEYIPPNLADKLKSQLELCTPLSEETKEKLEKLNKEIEDNFHEPLPEMSHDIFGLNHADILNRVQKLMKKSEALHRLSSSSSDSADLSLNINENPITFIDNKAERAAFKEFLAKRQIMQSKFKKRDKNYSPDIECIREELQEKSRKYFDNMDMYDNQEDDDDYIIEDEDDSQLKHN